MVERPPPYLSAMIPRYQTSEIQFTIETDEDTKKPAMNNPPCICTIPALDPDVIVSWWFFKRVKGGIRAQNGPEKIKNNTSLYIAIEFQGGFRKRGDVKKGELFHS
jgi:hypothetical protein